MLHPDFLARPIAHRALHDVNAGRPENSRAAIEAAIRAGYGIEIDIQRSSDGVAMVFHDYTLDRLAEATGPIATRTAAELGQLRLKGNDEGIPTLSEVLELVDGRVPLLIEVKDQDGQMGPNVGPLETAIAADLAGYGGPVALMSFNPNSVAALAELLPETARGLTTCSWRAEHWPHIPARPDRSNLLPRSFALLPDAYHPIQGLPGYRLRACYLFQQMLFSEAPALHHCLMQVLLGHPLYRTLPTRLSCAISWVLLQNYFY